MCNFNTAGSTGQPAACSPARLPCPPTSPACPPAHLPARLPTRLPTCPPALPGDDWRAGLGGKLERRPCPSTHSPRSPQGSGVASVGATSQLTIKWFKRACACLAYGMGPGLALPPALSWGSSRACFFLACETGGGTAYLLGGREDQRRWCAGGSGPPGLSSHPPHCHPGLRSHAPEGPGCALLGCVRCWSSGAGGGGGLRVWEGREKSPSRLTTPGHGREEGARPGRGRQDKDAPVGWIAGGQL